MVKGVIMSVRAKVVCQYVQDFGHIKEVRLIPVTPNADDNIPENERFHKYTPNGSITLTIDNLAAAEQFKPQHTYYLDFTPVEPKSAE
jgi:hypothetical protein